MLIPVGELKKYLETNVSDTVLEGKLQALELSIRAYTNNNFQNRNIRTVCKVMSGKLYISYPYIHAGDTIQITQSRFNDGLYTVKEIQDGFIELDKLLTDEQTVIVTKVEYPADIVMGAINMLKWDLDNRKKVGIQSETISRHSVTYFNMDGGNSEIGYLNLLWDFLNLIRKQGFERCAAYDWRKYRSGYPG